MSPKVPSRRKVYQIMVTLLETEPPIWRRFQVNEHTPLPRLHDILQEVMGWEDCHLHEFVVGDCRYGKPDPDWDDRDIIDERDMKLGGITQREGASFRYRYDFGDNWEHELVVEKILEREPGERYPICLAGERSCPSEDCGGVYGYVEFLEAIQDPSHPDHEDYVKWIGGEFDPDEFDLDLVNEVLEDMR